MRPLLLAALDEAYNKASWHGPNLRGAMRGVTAERAAWRPAPGRHNVWEIAVHAAYWKYVVWRLLTGAKRGGFALEGSNFFSRSGEAGKAGWKSDLALLDAEHKRLRATVAALPEAAFKDAKKVKMIRGIAAHDLYHAGQIRLLLRLGE